MSDTAPVTVIRGTVAGNPVSPGAASLRVLDERLVLETAAGLTTLELSSMSGSTSSRGRFAIYADDGSMLELETDSDAPALDRAIITRACSLPEFTLQLRALGSHRGNPGTLHDRFFAPLLAARKMAESAQSLRARLVAFDANRLSRDAQAALHTMASERHVQSAPHRRALDARLQELAEPLFHSLGILSASARAVEQAPGEIRVTRWREWTRALRTVFEQWDRCWIHAAPHLAAP